MNIKRFTDDWAYDLDIKTLSKGEIVNEDVINQSIEMILATTPGERLFRPSFGSNFSRRLFNVMDVSFYDQLLDDTTNAIKLWEDRIIVLNDEIKLKIDPDTHTATITIPYIIKQRNLKGQFYKVIRE